MEPLTAEEFFNAYAERSGYDPIELAKIRRAYRCTCDDDTCEGWAMLNPEYAHETRGIDPSDQGWTPGTT